MAFCVFCDAGTLFISFARGDQGCYGPKQRMWARYGRPHTIRGVLDWINNEKVSGPAHVRALFRLLFNSTTEKKRRKQMKQKNIKHQLETSGRGQAKEAKRLGNHCDL